MIDSLTLEYLRNIGGELSSIGEELEQLGAQLCADGIVIARHLHHLQAIDLIAQKQRSLARILCSQDINGSVQTCEIAGLGERLTSIEKQTVTTKQNCRLLKIAAKTPMNGPEPAICGDNGVIDLPPEKVIEQRLVQCGLNAAGVSVDYEDHSQSIELATELEAGLAREQFGCIQETAALSIMTFTDQDLCREYSDVEEELLRPKMVENARQSLKKIGRLTNFPVRSAYGSDKLFAEAIEVHCGVPKGRALREFGDEIAFMPPEEDYRGANKFSAIYGCLFEAIIYVAATRELTIGLIGNEEFRYDKSE